MPARALVLLIPLLGAFVAVVGPPAHAAGIEPMCVLLFSDGDGETLVNRCRSCREVTLQRVREGEGIPNVRSLMLPSAIAVQGPFRGPGRTRILGERTCPPPPGRSISEAALRR
jgi:hypothetical protein